MIYAHGFSLRMLSEAEDCCPLGARRQFIVWSREVSASWRFQNVTTISMGIAIGGMGYIRCTEVVRLITLSYNLRKKSHHNSERSEVPTQGSVETIWLR